MIKHLVGTAFAAGLLTSIGLAANVFTAPVAEAAASCGEAACVYDGTNYTGAVKKMDAGVCGQWRNMGDYGWNDRTSSIANFVKYTQTFYWDINMGGNSYNVGPFVKPASLGGWNNKISSAVWIG